jgi:hypothetical protein
VLDAASDNAAAISAVLIRRGGPGDRSVERSRTNCTRSDPPTQCRQLPLVDETDTSCATRRSFSGVVDRDSESVPPFLIHLDILLAVSLNGTGIGCSVGLMPAGSELREKSLAQRFA